MVDEYAALLRKDFFTIEKFINNSEVPHEDIVHFGLKAKCGIDPTADLIRIVSDKLDLIVLAGRELNICPSCSGTKMHIIPK